MGTSWKYTAILAGTLALFFGGIITLWILRPALYFTVLHGLGVDAFSKPFLDLSGVLAMGECHRLGIDPTLPSPCDPLRRILPYGPATLHEPFATADAMWLGVVQSILFLATVTLVLRPRTRLELAVTACASLSCGVMFALERGNFDLIEFLLVVAAVVMARRGVIGRLASYLLFLAGGTIKFYPFALLVTIARERLMVAMAVATASLAIIAGYILANRAILSKLSKALPPFEYNTDIFGAICLPFGLADWLTLPPGAGMAMMGGLILVFGFAAWQIARRLRATCQPADFETVNAQLLLAGAIVLAGCFFMGTSIHYRSIYLLLLLPGLFDLVQKPRLRRGTGVTIGAAVFCLWGAFFRQWGETGIDHFLDVISPNRGDALWGDAPSIVFFIARELVWWWVIAVMVAVVGLFLADARTTRESRRMLVRAQA